LTNADNNVYWGSKKQQQHGENKMKAVDLLNSDHPAHTHFIAWLKGKEPTKRQARKFLQSFPQYMG